MFSTVKLPLAGLLPSLQLGDSDVGDRLIVAGHRYVGPGQAITEEDGGES